MTKTQAPFFLNMNYEFQNLNKAIAFDKLLQVSYELREKCPWDKEQTWESLRKLSIEELYELTDALDAEDAEAVAAESGDVLLHILFYALIAEEQKLFNIEDVCNRLREKLIRRHPHIYGDVKVESAGDVSRNWEAIKNKVEKKPVLSGVPKSLPAMVKAFRLQEKAATVGFDWPDKEQVWEKVTEELSEFNAEIAQGKLEAASEEMGDLLFSIINYCRHLNIDPEKALSLTNAKFLSRFNYIEQKCKETGQSPADLSLQEMDKYWEEAKSRLNNKY